jgi:5-formyltetrahydrofolate cyclo-ligase
MEKHSQQCLVTALSVVIAPRMVLQFLARIPGCALAPGANNIPAPTQGEVVEANVLIVPMVGFDSQRYRLGYGGGFYDRTFAATTKNVRRIAVGFETARTKTIYPQTFDIPVDLVITENGPLMR